MERKREAALFLVRLNVFLIPLYLAMFFRLEWRPLQQFVLHSVAFLSSASVNGDMLLITDGSFAALIDWDCTGWKSMLFFVALVFATRSGIRDKAAAMLFLPLIFLINIFRIWSMLFLVSLYGTENFTIAHDIIWPLLFMAAVIAMWYIWLRFIRSGKLPHSKLGGFHKQIPLE